MKSFLVLPLAAVVVSGFLWWFAQGRHAATSQEPTTAASGSETPSSRPDAPEEAETAEVGPPALSVTRIPSCSLLPIQEQNVASQVDGLLLKIDVTPGQKVVKGQCLAQMDDSKILPQLHILEIRAASKSEELIAEAQFKEADARVKYAEAANRRDPKAVPELEVKTYLAQRERFEQEINKASEDRLAAQKELEKMQLLRSMHQIVSLMDGEVVKIFKREGEAIKQAETLFTIARTERLRIEGFCKAHQASPLQAGVPVLVEPELQGAQLKELLGHTHTVMDVAIACDGKVLASASKDGTVILWRWPEGTRLATLHHPAGVCAVDLAPAGGGSLDADYVIVTASEDGRVRGWSLKGAKARGPLWNGLGHEGPALCVRIDPEKQTIVSGGEDRKVGLWDLPTGKLLHWVHQPDAWKQTAHQGAVTDVQFGPGNSLYTCGTDHLLKVWSWTRDSAALVKEHRGRTGDVSRLGAMPAGTALLFDHADELRLVHPRSGNVLGALSGGKGVAFQGFASFSPSGRLVLSCTADGRCQVWKTPVHRADAAAEDSLALGRKRGGNEIRYYRLSRSVAMKCGTFSPDETAFFSGGTDRIVRAWTIPPEMEWHPRDAIITYVANTIEPGTDLVRIQAEMENGGARPPLRPGTFVHLKVFPPNPE